MNTMHHKTDIPKAGIDYSIPGMRIERFDPDDAWALVVRCAAAQPEWILDPTTLAKRIATKEVPTTIMYRETAYRIHEVEEKNESWIYRMARCPEGEPQIQKFDLLRESIEAIATEEKETERELLLLRSSVFYDWTLGWLPAEIQEKLAERILFNPEDASRKNALLECVFGLVACVLCTAYMFAGFYVGAADFFFEALFMLLIALEGFIRLGHIIAGGKPLGLFALEGAVRGAKVAKKVVAYVKTRLKS